MTGKRESIKPLEPLDMRTSYFTFGATITLLTPALFAAGAAFAPTTRGPIIASAFLLPPVLFIVVRFIEQLHGGYQLSTVYALFPIIAFLYILAGFVLPYAFLDLNTPYLWAIWASLACPLVLGLLIGLARHDKEALHRSLMKRFAFRDGNLIENRNTTITFGMRSSTGSASIDFFVKIVWAVYSVLIVIGMFLGGGAAFVLSGVLEGIVARPAELDIRVMVIEIVAFLAIGPLGVYLPVFWRLWRGVAALEREASIAQS